MADRKYGDMMRKWVLLIATIMIMTTLAGCLGGGDDGNRVSNPVGNIASGKPIQEKGYCGAPEEDNTEPSTVTLNIDLNETEITEVSFKLTWTDDESGSDPDTFILHTKSNSTSGEKSGDSGPLKLDFPGANSTASNTVLGNIWEVRVECVESGDDWIFQTPWGTGLYNADPGNSWKLDITYKYMSYER